LALKPRTWAAAGVVAPIGGEMIQRGLLAERRRQDLQPIKLGLKLLEQTKAVRTRYA
jgi:hypothetical protein